MHPWRHRFTFARLMRELNDEERRWAARFRNWELRNANSVLESIAELCRGTRQLRSGLREGGALRGFLPVHGAVCATEEFLHGFRRCELGYADGGGEGELNGAGDSVDDVT